MPAATTKSELLAVTDKEWGKLSGLLAEIPAKIALTKDEEDTSIKDVIAHRAHWIDLFLGWYTDGMAGQEVAFPAPGYKWSDLKRYNADVRAKQADLGWDAARDLLSQRHDALRSFLASLSDGELYGGAMKGARNNWTAGRWAEATGPSHYRSAAKYVRGRLREV